MSHNEDGDVGVSQIGDSELVAFARGHLSAEARARVEAWLDQSPTNAELVARYVGMFVDASADPLQSTVVGGPPPRGEPIQVDLGTRIGRYRVDDLLGAGGMGVVYSAFDPALDRSVALKLIRPSVSDPKHYRARLLREARALAAIAHPNVVAAYDVGTHEGSVYVAMELVQGRTLTRWVLDDRPSWPAIVEAFRAAGAGLAAAHRAGIVHRDFKPDNVLIDQGGAIKVTDFGLANLERAEELSRDSDGEPMEPTAPDGLELGGATLTQAGMVVGTPVFMSPEQLRGNEVDFRSDIFAFCVSLYMALWDQRPFEGDGVDELLRACMTTAPRRPPANSAVPSWVRRVIVRGLSADPSERQASMVAVCKALAPRSRRRRVRWFAGATAAAGIVAPVVWSDTVLVAAPNPCEVGARRIERVWSSERRDEIAGALASVDSSTSVPTDRILEILDASARSWVRSFRETCEANRGSSERDRTRVCLDRWLGGFDQAVTLLGSSDAAVARRAVSIVSAVGEPEQCVGGLESRRPTPPPHIAVSVERARDRLSRALVLIRGGRYEDALGIVRGVRRDAAALEFTPLQVEATRRWGDTLDLVGKLEPAREAYTEAFWLAQASGYDYEAAEAATNLVFLTGERLFDVEEAETWARHAQSSIARLEDADMISNALLSNMALVSMRRGQYAVAQLQLELAVAIAESKLGPDDHRVSNLLVNLASAHHRQDQFDRAAELYLRALEIRRQHYGGRHPMVADTLMNLASSTKRQGDLDGALRLYEAAQRMFVQTLGPDHPSVATVHLNIALLLDDMKRYDEIEAHLDRALSILQPLLGPDHPHVVLAVVRKAALAWDLGEPGEGLVVLDEAAVSWGNLAQRDPLSFHQAQMLRSRLLEAVGELQQARDVARELVVFARAELAETSALREAQERLTSLDRSSSSGSGRPRAGRKASPAP